MSKTTKKEQTITINDKEYNLSDFTPEQAGLMNHVADLDRKIGSSQFNLNQLMFGKEAFVNALANSLESPEEFEEVE
tara:strand:+ start:127 stop:357 length:231 start_codon:yes stop_codon:yes gene_type:complete